jgi:hypothetical protein
MKLSLFCTAALAVSALASSRGAAQSFPAPPGGWLYAYEGDQDSAGSGGFTALDGTFSHDDGSDEWDGTSIGVGKPGGVVSVDGALRLQDTGDPRDYGFSDPGSNRKLYLGHDLTADGASATQLNDGVTLNFRARVPTTGPLDDLHPDGGGGTVPYPAGGDGCPIHGGGKGNVSLKQAAGGVISFSLDPDVGGLQMNSLNGTAVTGDVDTGEGSANVLGIDVTQWHDYYVTIAPGGAGTHLVSVYVDGALPAAATFDVTVGDGSDFAGITYVAVGCGDTPASGAIDIDFVRVAAGAVAPGGAVPMPNLSTFGLFVVGLLMVGVGCFALRRRRSA